MNLTKFALKKTYIKVYFEIYLILDCQTPVPDMKIPEDSYINKTCAVLKSLTEVIEYLKYNR